MSSSNNVFAEFSQVKQNAKIAKHISALNFYYVYLIIEADAGASSLEIHNTTFIYTEQHFIIVESLRKEMQYMFEMFTVIN